MSTSSSSSLRPSSSSGGAPPTWHCQGLSVLPQQRVDARKVNGHAWDPQRDGLVVLEQEHDSISDAMRTAVQLAQDYCERQEGDPDKVDQLVSHTVALVSQHASLEERYVYPLFASHLKGSVRGISADMIYERNVADDNVNKAILDLLLQMRLQRDGKLMLSTLQKFQIIEEEHMTQEEHWFSLLRSQMSAADLSSLASTIRSAAQTAPTRPHSVVGPSHGLAARLTHPVAGVIDRAVDALEGRDVALDTKEGGAKKVHGVEAEAQVAGGKRDAAEGKQQQSQQRQQEQKQEPAVM